MLFLIVGAVLLIGISHYLVTSTDAYKQAIRLAQSSPEIKNLLGEDIKVEGPVLGFASESNGGKFVVFTARLAGLRGKGHLYGVANAVNEEWEFWRLSLRCDHEIAERDVSPAPRRLSLPGVPAKKIFLLPIDLAANESLSWAPAYYRAKLGIEVELLPPAPLPQNVEDPQRHQVDSERLLERIRFGYSQLASDPSNILIAITSRDIFIRSFGWRYVENYRENGVAVVSGARLHPLALLDHWNPEWFHSRLQKMLTKNIALLYFDLPMSSDYTSLLSGGVLSGREIDLVSGSIIGAEGRWAPFLNHGDVETSIYAVPGRPPVWQLSSSRVALPQTSAHLFNADLTIGLFVDRKVDFLLGGDYPFEFTRVYRNQDPKSRSFGIGANDSLDIFLIGEMGRYIDLVFEDGGRLHFVNAPGLVERGDTYRAERASGSPFSYARAVFLGGVWTVERLDGWKFYFPYQRRALGSNVTVLTGFSDPSGKRYDMVRNQVGDLLALTTPTGDWLRFERDDAHRVRSILASSGRKVSYEYDAAGRLAHVSDSSGNQESYTYDERAQMLSITVGDGKRILLNSYDLAGNISEQEMGDGEKFRYHYTRDPGSRGNGLMPDLITAPNGLLTYIRYENSGYAKSLPVQSP